MRPNSRVAWLPLKFFARVFDHDDMGDSLASGRRRRSDDGFTLVEVIVVLSVILLLTGIAVPLLSSYMEDGRRARAEAEIKMLSSAFTKANADLGSYPARSSGGNDSFLYVLMTGSTKPASNPWTRGHRWINWAMNATRGDLLDEHLLRNSPGGQSSAAYPTSGNLRWRGPYLAGTSPLDPWGRPYLINVGSAWRTHASRHKRMFVISAGPNGQFDTSWQSLETTEIAGDDIGVTLALKQ